MALSEAPPPARGLGRLSEIKQVTRALAWRLEPRQVLSGERSLVAKSIDKIALSASANAGLMNRNS
jgi:hypothetical protein